MNKNVQTESAAEQAAPQKQAKKGSYNRKFRCGCVATNGHPATIWSTRAVEGTCKRCGEDYWEVDKAGAYIEVAVSDIENGVDAVRERMLHKEGYRYFDRYVSLSDRKEMLDEISALHDGDESQYAYGTYQRHHRSYTEGYRYWVAYNSKPVHMEAEEVEAPPVAEATSEDEPEAPRVYSHTNPADILELYRTENGCTTRKLAEKLNVAQSTLMGYIRKFNIDFNAGTYTLPE